LNEREADLVVSVDQQVPDDEVRLRRQQQYADFEGDDADRETLLDTQIPMSRPKHVRKKGCCVCFGIE
jgi:hypothetical protein